MAEITAKLVKELREKSGAGVMDAKKALVEVEGDIEKAIELLREKGMAKAAKKADIDIIGQFGVGFYSAFIVADKVTLETRSPYSENGVRWVSSGDGNYEIEEISKENRGTEITLHLKDGEEYSEFLEEWKIKELVKKYSNYIRYEIYFKDEVINSTKPIWKEIKKS